MDVYFDADPVVCIECGGELDEETDVFCLDCGKSQDYEPHCGHCGAFPHEAHEPGCYLYEDDAETP